MEEKQANEEKNRTAIRIRQFELKSIPGLMTTVAGLNRNIRQLQKEKNEALDVLARKFKNAPSENLLAVRDNKDFDVDVRWTAGFILSIEHGIMHNP
ncbi:hypothetical protein KKB43_02465 [Patescibacteria group bacterium]|nr:hypothetical protein [Patescibacteria group bacterium]MBU4579855.1 hypothetical protein [Patescibacteria group bacterium]